MGSIRVPSPEFLLGKRTLIVGKTRSGKTKLTADLLKGMLNFVNPEEVTVIDLAPRKSGLGSPLTNYLELPSVVRLLRPEVLRAPRLEGRNAEEVFKLARSNEEAIRPLLFSFLSKPTEVLVMNDLTIYLHAGDPELLMECLRVSRTFLGNAYYGRGEFDDKGSGLNERERELVEELMKHADLIVKLS